MRGQAVQTGTRGLRIAMTSLAIVALAAPSGASARATAEVDVGQGPLEGLTTNSCTGETAPASGHTVAVNREVVDGAGGVHTASIGTTVLQSEDAVSINHQADAGPSNFNANGATNVTDVIQIMTVSRGSEDNEFEHINHTDVITPTGERTANPVNVRQDCQG